MRWTGPFLAAFIVYHLLHLTTGTVHPSFREGDVYHNLVAGLRVTWVAVFYIVAMGCLALHTFHGVWSMFQSLGVSQPRYESFARRLATIFTIIVVGGFVIIPIAVLAGLLKVQ
jgi:succinate dehydrogenase / fumarate reductase cytochrome b subunit